MISWIGLDLFVCMLCIYIENVECPVVWETFALKVNISATVLNNTVFIPFSQRYTSERGQEYRYRIQYRIQILLCQIFSSSMSLWPVIPFVTVPDDGGTLLLLELAWGDQRS